MEWVETTGRTIEEAKNKALDQLGVAEDDAEFDVLDEPRAGLFGRVRGEARVRARVRPTQPRPKLDRRDRKKKAESRTDSATAATPVSSDDAESAAPPAAPRSRSNGAPKRTNDAPRERRPRREAAPAAQDNDTKETIVDAQQVGDEAQRFVQGVVDAFGLDGTVGTVCEGDEIEVSVAGSDLGVLVGPRGVTLQALQELTRVAAQRRLGDHETRLRVDVAGYRERRRVALGAFAQQVAAQVVADAAPRRLEPMSSADRKIVHDVLAEYDGVVTHSEGDDPQRCVVIAPANG